MTLTHAGCDFIAELPMACASDNRSASNFCQKQLRTKRLENVQNTLRDRALLTHDDCAVRAPAFRRTGPAGARKRHSRSKTTRFWMQAGLGEALALGPERTRAGFAPSA